MYSPSPRSYRRAFSALPLLCGLFLTVNAQAYERITDSEEVVLNKLFTKKSKIELDGRFGSILNTSYTQTFTLSGGLTYFWSEEWGFSGEGILALNKDKGERYCIERFYNRVAPEKMPADANGNTGSECPEQGEPPVTFGAANEPNNYGPAYVPIRELKYIITGNAVWNPLYGKQIILLSATNYFDFFIKFGGGLAMSDFYEMRTTVLGESKASRVTDKNKYIDGKPKEQNPGTLDVNKIGDSGRPEPIAQTTPLIHLAVGERFHFLKRFILTGSLDNYTLFGDGLENFFTISGGLGVRF